MDPPEVHVGELARLVAWGVLGLLEPGDRLFELALLHQVATDIVVGVAEVRVDLDRLETLARRFLEAPLEAHGPPEERVRLRRRAHVDGPLVELDRALEVALHLVGVRLLPERGRAPHELGVTHRRAAPSERPRLAAVTHLPEHPLVAAPRHPVPDYRLGPRGGAGPPQPVGGGGHPADPRPRAPPSGG